MVRFDVYYIDIRALFIYDVQIYLNRQRWLVFAYVCC